MTVITDTFTRRRDTVRRLRRLAERIETAYRVQTARSRYDQALAAYNAFVNVDGEDASVEDAYDTCLAAYIERVCD